jgi:hypothetical protein
VRAAAYVPWAQPPSSTAPRVAPTTHPPPAWHVRGSEAARTPRPCWMMLPTCAPIRCLPVHHPKISLQKQHHYSYAVTQPWQAVSTKDQTCVYDAPESLPRPPAVPYWTTHVRSPSSPASRIAPHSPCSATLTAIYFDSEATPWHCGVDGYA